MRIGIDARIFKFKDYRGIASATYSIINILSQNYKSHDFYLISNTQIHLPSELPDNWHIVVEGKNRNGILWTILELPGVIKDLKLDAFWSPNFILPKRVKGCRYFVTVHDLALFKFKGTASIGTYLTLKLLGKRSCKYADKVFAISEATKNDVIDLYGVSSNKVSVCYNGVDTLALRNTEAKPIQKLKLKEGSYFIFLSTIEPRKNPVTVLQAYEQYRDKNLGEEKLVFVGSEGWNLQSFQRAYDLNNYKEDIIFTGYVSESHKKWLIENALVLLYPSIYEGFGLPILEAFALGTPVITSNVSAMPEVGGDAAIYVNSPESKEELVSAMCKIKALSQDELSKLKDKMAGRAKSFSWLSTAEIIMNEFMRDDYGKNINCRTSI